MADRLNINSDSLLKKPEIDALYSIAAALEEIGDLLKGKAVDKEKSNLTEQIHRACDDICINYCKYEEYAFDSMEEDEILEVCGKCPLNLLR